MVGTGNRANHARETREQTEGEARQPAGDGGDGRRPPASRSGFRRSDAVIRITRGECVFIWNTVTLAQCGCAAVRRRTGGGKGLSCCPRVGRGEATLAFETLALTLATSRSGGMSRGHTLASTRLRHESLSCRPHQDGAIGARRHGDMTSLLRLTVDVCVDEIEPLRTRRL